MTGPAQGFLGRAWAVLWDVINHLSADDGFAMASHVALSAIMALFPFLIFVASVAGFFGEAALANRVAELVFEAWPPEVAGPIADEVRRVLTEGHRGLLTVSALVALYLATNGVEAVRTALNRAYRVVDRRSILYCRAQSVAFVLIGTVLILAVAGLVVAVTALPMPLFLQQNIGILGASVSGALILGALIAAHLWLPAGRPGWRHLWPGIASTVVLWLLSAWIFAYYLRSFANYAATYAGLAGIVTAMFFLYVVALIMIFGAEFNAALGRLRQGRL